MRSRAILIGILGLLAWQGIAAKAHAGSSVQLFTDHGEPRFAFYLACVSKSVDCGIIERMFGRWADDRGVNVHTVTPEQAASLPADMAKDPAEDTPYRVTVRYAPEMGSVSNSLVSGATGLPLISYVANVHVFDAATGKLLKSMTWRKEDMADRDHGAANPYLDAQVRDFLKHLDPTYASSPAS
ncbi:hypothetical protein SAMN04487785_11149 [Dyella jiangningensis]|uniref:hypothetical protein n=1 Tax=Dyella sp. AtDHG13 TaxID=1938897 RepID=UPI0008828FB5|nr:hypothetical protein [Dyella sp. AtDHG13]PXV55399.1 hypothetical protein BDW41_111104 [Dyella sp. AtDHG13]SDK77914.1 hypothetical protein SAMN04487785_11149 [Dyella jiangningensis]